MKHIAFTVIAGFLLGFASHASASVVRARRHQKNSAVQTYVSPLGPSASVISTTSALTRQQMHQARREARLAAMQVAYTPTVSTAQAVTALAAPVTRVRRNRRINSTVITRPAIITAASPAALAATPEPASVSFLLMGLFGAGLFYVRRRQANNNPPAV